jgi:hypothetical protein
MEEKNIRSIFIFGKHDNMYPPKIGNTFIRRLKHAEVLILDDNHEMINSNFVEKLSGLLI